MKHIYTVVALLVAAPLAAQPRPGAFTTLVTTDTSVASLCVGGNAPAAPSTCLGGLQSGTIIANQAITLPSFTPASTTNRLYNVGGTLTWAGSPVSVGGAVGPGTIGAIPVFTGANSIGDSILSQAGTVLTLAGTLVATVFGTNTFAAGGAGDHTLAVRNTSAGATNRGQLTVGNDTSASLAKITANASTYTTLGPDIANGVKLEANGVGGLVIRASNAVGNILFFTGTGTVQRGQISAAGLVQWDTFGTHQFEAGGTGAQLFLVRNPTAGAGNSGQITVRSDTGIGDLQTTSSTFTTAGSLVQASTAVRASGVGGLSLAATAAAGAVRIYTGSDTLRATYEADGDYALGANLTDSVAVPTLAGCGATATIVGRNYAFQVTPNGAGISNTCTVSFNTTFANRPTCTFTGNQPGRGYAALSTTTQVIVSSFDTTTAGLVAFVAGQSLDVICRGI